MEKNLSIFTFTKYNQRKTLFDFTIKNNVDKEVGHKMTTKSIANL